MKWVKRIFVGIIVFLGLLFAIGYLWLRSSKPQYTGEMSIPGIGQSVEVYFDDFGVPHIYAENKHDLYVAFGYLHAQDRLFQMEMMRRAGSGTLAEIIGRPMLEADKLFRTLGLVEYAQNSAAQLRKHSDEPMYVDIMAYLQGVNQYIKQGPTPPEFALIGIDKREFTLEDLYYITGAMSFNFSQAQRTEPIIDFVAKNFNRDYLGDIGIWHRSNETFIPTHYPKLPGYSDATSVSTKPSTAEVLAAFAQVTVDIENIIPMAPLQGSNSWVLGSQKTKNKSVVFCNDTHIGYMIPQTWYEAHLSAPDFEMYGHFLAGIPFALVGRNRQLSWGLTMLLNDDMDFYYEKESDSEKHSYWENGSFQPAQIREHTIRIKGEQDTVIQVIHTSRGPIINEAFSEMNAAVPISMYWTYTQLPNRTVEAFYGMNNATNFSEFERNLSLIHAPGLNINYGDVKGNVAWWGCAALIQRVDTVNSYTILDGSNPAHQPKGFYSFDVNPRSINPPSGYIYSANDWPQAIVVPSLADSTFDTLWYPGYYKPQYRADRIRALIDPKDDWDIQTIQQIMTDHTNQSDADLMKLWYSLLEKNKAFTDSTFFRQYDELFHWDGQYTPMSTSATFFNKMLYNYLRLTMEDELGTDLFQLFLHTHLSQRAAPQIAFNANSPWWNNIHTQNNETRDDIVFEAYCITISQLRNQFGNNPSVWNWRKAATLELKHPLGAVALFKPIFSIAAQPVYGGNETILQSGFRLDSSGNYAVNTGSQMRIIVDMAQPDSALNITPSGNSGHVCSPYYKDQAPLYRQMQFRTQWMSKNRVAHHQSLTIVGKK